MMISLSFFSGQTQPHPLVAPPPVGPKVLTLPNFTLAAEVDPESGEVALTLTLEGVVAGTFTLTPEQYSMPQHNLLAPVITGTVAVGQTLTVTQGLWLVDPSTAPTMSYKWLADGMPIAGATGMSHVIRAEDVGRTITCRETVGSAFVDSNQIALPPVLQLARVGGFQSSSAATPSPSFTVNLTGYNAGDRIVFFYGQNEFATAATVNGAAATKLGTDSGTHGSRGRVSAFTYTLTAPGAAGTVIAFSTINNNAHVFSCHGIKGGSVSAVLQAYSTPGDPIGGSLAIAAAGSHVIAIDIGNAGGVPVTWTGVTMVDEAELTVASTTAATSLAEASGVAAGALAITANNAGGSLRHGLFAAAIQPTS